MRIFEYSRSCVSAALRWWLLTALLALATSPVCAQTPAAADPKSPAAGKLSDRGFTLVYSQPTAALALGQQSLARARADGSRREQANAYTLIGLSNLMLDRLPLAEQAIQQSLRLFEQMGNLSGQSQCLSSLGSISFSQGDYPAALRSFERSLRLYNQMPGRDSLENRQLYGSIGNIYLETQRPAQALPYFERTRRLARLAADSAIVATAGISIGTCYARLGRYSEALAELVPARAAVAATRAAADHAMALQGLGEVAAGQGKWAEAAAFCRESARVGAEFPEYVRESHHRLADVLAHLGDHAAAYDHLRQYQALKDSLYRRQTTDRLNALETRYRTREQQQQIQAQQLTIERRSQLVALGFGTAALVLLGAAGVGWQARRLSRANAVIRRTVRQKEALMQEVHHRVKNNLQLVKSLLGWQADVNPALAAALAESRDRIQSMALIHEHLYRADDISRVRLDDYLNQLLRTLEAAHAGTGPPITLTAELAPLTVGADVAIPLGLVVNELVSNAYKHAFRGRAGGRLRVTLTPAEAPPGFRLRVEDDGVGVPPERGAARPGSMGMQLMALMADQLGVGVREGSGERGGAWFEVG